MMQVSLVTPITHSIAKPRRCVGLAILGDEERQVP
jgi:hypothetical protein